MTLTVGSLFSGIGGLDLGLERAGMSVLWQVEKDPYAQKVLRKNWPDVRLHDDVRNVHALGLGCNDCLDPVDLICGGFPCQDISNAGKRAGINGQRSGLWSEFARIVDEVRPSWVLVENVAALRSRGLARVLGDLAACGYDAEWDCIPAAAFGAPHRRDRLFVVAYAKRDLVRQQSGRGSGTGGPGPTLFASNGQQRAVADAERTGLEVGGVESARQAAERGGAQGDPWATEPDVGRVAHGVPARVDRLRCLGNAVVPAVAQYVGERIMACHLANTQERDS